MPNVYEITKYFKLIINLSSQSYTKKRLQNTKVFAVLIIINLNKYTIAQYVHKCEDLQHRRSSTQALTYCKAR